jgi:hypothetical protein
MQSHLGSVLGFVLPPESKLSPELLKVRQVVEQAKLSQANQENEILNPFHRN